MILLFTLNGLKPSKGPDALRKLQRRRRPASEQDLKFLSGVKSDRFVSLHATHWRKLSIKKIWSLFLVGVFQSKARKIISYLRGNQTVKMEDSYIGMLHDDPYSEYSYYVPAASPGPSTLQFVHPGPMQTTWAIRITSIAIVFI